MPQLTMPNVGEGVTEGTVTRWLKAEGDHVSLDDLVVEVETDKAVVEIPSPFEGTLSKILVAEGAIVPIGTALAEFDAATSSASVPIEAGAEGVTGRPALAATPTSKTVVEATPPEKPRADPAVAASNGAVVPAEVRRTRQYSPVVINLAGEHGIDLALVRGTGIAGRVTRQDVMRYFENPAANTVAPASHEGVVGADRKAGRAAQPAATPPSSPVPLVEHDAGADTVIPLTPMRRTIAARMTESHQTIPVAWMSVEADVTGLVALRDRVKQQIAATEGVKLTYMPIFIQAIVGALKEHAQVNASYAADGITLHARHDIGIAIATEAGLVVPVIRDAGEKSLAGLARELDGLAAKARDRKLTIDEMRGATMTIDNTGAFGSVLSQPILPVGQAAIITTETIRRELRPLEGDAFGVRSVMNLCITIDHRALDGAEAGAFMESVRARLQAYTGAQPAY